MASFERFDIVRVPFPFTDRHADKNRPALVLSDSAAFNRPAGHGVMAMVTSAGPATGRPGVVGAPTGLMAVRVVLAGMCSVIKNPSVSGVRPVATIW